MGNISSTIGFIVVIILAIFGQKQPASKYKGLLTKFCNCCNHGYSC
ncbi:hypothetical protein K9O30_07980 [Clostridium bowmanii]|nr:hypothetical protein [Clostridium bowmanii]MBU3188927.1 hypothetical protein [Clostridium bowmanii]MCA1073664.1 hypothetical protein [Clostridium bowmanii]